MSGNTQLRRYQWRSTDRSEALVDTRGLSWLLAEGGVPVRVRSAYLTDEQVYELADHAAAMRARDREAA